MSIHLQAWVWRSCTLHWINGATAPAAASAGLAAWGLRSGAALPWPVYIYSHLNWHCSPKCNLLFFWSFGFSPLSIEAFLELRSKLVERLLWVWTNVSKKGTLTESRFLGEWPGWSPHVHVSLKETLGRTRNMPLGSRQGCFFHVSSSRLCLGHARTCSQQASRCCLQCWIALSSYCCS